MKSFANPNFSEAESLTPKRINPNLICRNDIVIERVTKARPWFWRVCCAVDWMDWRDLKNDAAKESIFCCWIGISLSQSNRSDSIFFRTGSSAWLSICSHTRMRRERERECVCSCFVLNEKFGLARHFCFEVLT